MTIRNGGPRKSGRAGIGELQCPKCGKCGSQLIAVTGSAEVIDHQCDHSDGCGYCAVLLSGFCADEKAYREAKQLLRAKNAAIAALEAELETQTNRADTNLTALTALRQRAERAESALEDWQNREAAVCPEDVGFEEMIQSLRQRADELQAKLDLLSDPGPHGCACV